MRKGMFVVLLAAAVMLICGGQAGADGHPGYVYSTDGKTPVRDGDGHCVRQTDWRPEYATAECNPELLPKPKAVAPAPAPAPVAKTDGDSDGDGVTDSLDKCPNTPQGVSVDKNGCPADSDGDGVPDYLDKCPNTPQGVSVDKNGCPADSDGDGVPDNMDKCPDTPKGVTVDQNGCPADSDGDGVPDYMDKCPDTPKGAKVDAAGCPVKLTEKVSINLAIEFDSGKADIKSKYDEQIKKVADFMRTYPDTSAVIEGYTDNVGKEATNVRLSTKRAESVRDELIKKFGIAANRLSVKGYGSARPIADNATPAGRQKNRRIEAVIEATVTR